MKQFKYRAIEIKYQSGNPPILQYDGPMEAGAFLTHNLDDLGNEGWELVAIIERPVVVGIFKQEQQSTPSV